LPDAVFVIPGSMRRITPESRTPARLVDHEVVGLGSACSWKKECFFDSYQGKYRADAARPTAALDQLEAQVEAYRLEQAER
jgi:hypothetical protein